MKFTGFKVIPSIRVRFFGEGEFHYEIADDQDPAALEIARLAEVEADCELPEAIELRWAPGSAHMAFRDVDSEEGDESPVSGDFCGFGAILQASYEQDGQVHSFSLCEGDFVECIEQMCAGLNALLAPVRIVADISGGALHGTYADRPAVVLYKSDEPDDVLAQERFSDDEMVKGMGGENVAAWVQEAELFSDIVDHYHNQVKPCC